MANAPVFLAGLATIVLDGDRQFATVRAGDLKHPPNWVRRDLGTPEERTDLARSYQNRPINLIVVSPQGVVRDGNRRVAAIIEDSGPDTEVKVCITSEEITPAVELEIMLETSQHTKSLTPYEQFVGYSEWLKITGATAKQLAARIRCHESTVSRILSLERGEAATVEAARSGAIGPNEWALVVKSDDQAETLRLLGSGEIKGRAELAAAVKDAKQPKRDADTSKLPTVVIAMPEARKVVLKGGINLQSAKEMLAASLKLVEKAIEDGLSTKNAQGLWKDTSKKPKVKKTPKSKVAASD